MSWEETFAKGVEAFKSSRLEESLKLFNEAIKKGGQCQFIIYDSRAAVYEKLGRPKEALGDAKQVIDLAPDRWQGYARAARLFLKARKFDASSKMADLALARLKPTDSKRHVELSTLKGSVDVARREADEHQRRMQNHFCKLPVEILGEIFKIIIRVDTAALIVLLHVCQHWRGIIWNTPALWSTLVLGRHDPAAKAKLWVERSRGRVQEFCQRIEMEHHADKMYPCLRNLLWDKLRVCRIKNWDLSGYLTSISMSHVLSTFEELEVVDQVPGLLNRTTLFTEDSRLRSLTLDGSLFSWNNLSLYLNNLTSLVVLNAISHEGNYLPMLQANPQLETLVLDFKYGQIPSPTDGTQTLSLPHLTHLDLAGLTWTPGLLERLDLPMLKSLRISRGNTSLDVALRNLSVNGSTHLTDLCISSCAVKATVLIQLLNSTTSLQSLQLSYLSNTANFVLEALASSSSIPEEVPGSDTMCPALIHLNVSYCPDVKTGPLVRLVKARLPTVVTAEDSTRESTPTVHPSRVAKIKSLNVDGCSQVDVVWLPWFRQNVEVVSCVYMSKKAAKWKR